MHHRLLPLLTFLTACGASDSGETDTPTTDAATADDTASVPTSETGAAELGPTYYQDVAPVISERCSGCHVDGGAAPFSLTNYAQASALAPAMVSSIEAGTMPPWPPGGDTPALLHDRSLLAAERELLLAWAEAGAPEGDPADPAPLRLPEQVELPTLDLSTDIGADFVADASISDDYHCFVIDLAMTEDRVATGYKFTPGNGKTVHHVLSTLFTGASRPAIDAVDAETSGVGWSCFGGYSNIPGAESVGALGGWVPGVTAVNYPASTGVSVPAGALLVVQIHYNTAGGSDPDRTSLDLAFAPKAVEPQLQLLRTSPFPWPAFTLPAGEKNIVVEHRLDARVTKNQYPDGDAYIVGVAGHMHLLGIEFALTIIGPEGTRRALEIPRWDFHWQGSYELVTPIRVGPDDEVELRCVYDNSAEHRAAQGMGPPIDVKWGEGTQDEMCLGYLQMIDDLP